MQLQDIQWEQLRAYGRLLQDRKQYVNLTGLSKWEDIWEQLILRSLRATLPLVALPRGSAIVDIGTGAGVPGLILKIAFPQLVVSLIDATRKKIGFLQEAIEGLGLEGVQAFHGRAETLAHDSAHREAYDVAVARSVGSLAELAELLLPFVRPGGRALALKGEDVEAELRLSHHASSLMGADRAETLRVGEPGLSAPETVVLWHKACGTPAAYPRKPGMPHKRPLTRPAAAGS